MKKTLLYSLALSIGMVSLSTDNAISSDMSFNSCYQNKCTSYQVKLTSGDDEDGQISGTVFSKEQKKDKFTFQLFCHDEYGTPTVYTNKGEEFAVREGMKTKTKGMRNNVLLSTWKTVCK